MADQKPKADDAVVEYKGSADVRQITAAQWRGAGVEDQGTVQWDRSNSFKVKASELTPAALEVLKADSEMKLPS